MRKYLVGFVIIILSSSMVFSQELFSKWNLKFSDSLQLGITDTLIIQTSDTSAKCQNSLTIYNSPTFSWIAFNAQNISIQSNAVSFYNVNFFKRLTAVIIPLKDTLFLQAQWFSKNNLGTCKLDYGFESFLVKPSTIKAVIPQKDNKISLPLIHANTSQIRDTLRNTARILKQDRAEGAVSIQKPKQQHAPRLFKDATCFSIQFGRFEQASDKRIRIYVKQLGIKTYKLQHDTDFKVILYGAFTTKDEAVEALQDFKKRYNTDAFIVEYHFKTRIFNK
jgi:hypothetical protein